MIELRCHCSAIHLQVSMPPKEVAICNCSICFRLACLWSYYSPADVHMLSERDELDTYQWGDKTLQICRCKTCGCTTHWESIDPEYRGRVGVNARMMEKVDLDQLPVRHIDGAAF